MTRDHGKNYSIVGIILKVNNKVVVEHEWRRSCFTKPSKSVLFFRNNVTRFHYKIQRRKFVWRGKFDITLYLILIIFNFKPKLGSSFSDFLFGKIFSLFPLVRQDWVGKNRSVWRVKQTSKTYFFNIIQHAFLHKTFRLDLYFLYTFFVCNRMKNKQSL